MGHDSGLPGDRCRVMFSVKVAKTATLGGVAPIDLAVVGKTR